MTLKIFFCYRFSMIVSLTIFSSCVGIKETMKVKLEKNPSYVVINNEEQSQEKRSVLTKRAMPVSFPLSEEDKEILSILEDKFDHEKNCAGLAAVQIGVSKQMIVFAAPENPDLKKWRPDFTQSMPKTIWLNPSYEPVDEDVHEDYEGCFSVHDLAAPVKRYARIRYHAFLPDGSEVSGIAEGYLARIIQHETDHVNGVLFLSRAQQDQIMSISEYRKARAKRIAESNGKD